MPMHILNRLKISREFNSNTIKKYNNQPTNQPTKQPNQQAYLDDMSEEGEE
jgi:hypothetical protein